MIVLLVPGGHRELSENYFALHNINFIVKTSDLRK